MLKDKKSDKSNAVSNSQNRIGHGTVITGELKSTSGFRIDGTIDGSVDSDSKVVVGKDGLVKGTLSCRDADVEGKVTGNLVVGGTLTLKSTAVIEGDVIVGKLAVEPGATFNASCSMKDNVKSLNRDAKKQA